MNMSVADVVGALMMFGLGLILGWAIRGYICYVLHGETAETQTKRLWKKTLGKDGDR